MGAADRDDAERRAADLPRGLSREHSWTAAVRRRDDDAVGGRHDIPVRPALPCADGHVLLRRLVHPHRCLPRHAPAGHGPLDVASRRARPDPIRPALRRLRPHPLRRTRATRGADLLRQAAGSAADESGDPAHRPLCPELGEPMGSGGGEPLRRGPAATSRLRRGLDHGVRRAERRARGRRHASRPMGDVLAHRVRGRPPEWLSPRRTTHLRVLPGRIRMGVQRVRRPDPASVAPGACRPGVRACVRSRFRGRLRQSRPGASGSSTARTARRRRLRHRATGQEGAPAGAHAVRDPAAGMRAGVSGELHSSERLTDPRTGQDRRTGPWPRSRARSGESRRSRRSG